MLTSHADEIGLMVTSRLPQGTLRITKIGYPTDLVLPGQRVRVLASTGTLEGVVGVRPGHATSPEQARQVPALGDLYVDVGAESADQAREWGIEPGTPIVLVGELTATRNPHRVFGKSVDNRAGLLTLLEVARRLQPDSLNCQLVYVVTVEEEIGLRGAAVAAQHVQPDLLIALDTVPAGGTPELRVDELPWCIGQGPLIKVRETHGLMTHRPFREYLRSIARKHQIPYQWIVDTAGITDASSAQQATGRTAAAVLGLPRRYSHSAVELFDLRDLAALIDLTTRALQELPDLATFNRLDSPSVG